jgi:hypothetical protein
MAGRAWLGGHPGLIVVASKEKPGERPRGAASCVGRARCWGGQCLVALAAPI